MSVLGKSFILALPLLFIAQMSMANNAKLLLTRDIEKAVKTLARETNLYHYFYANMGGHHIEKTTMQNYEGRQKYINGRLEFAGQQFYNLNRTSTNSVNAGPGLYLAVDPHSSSPMAARFSGANFGDSMIEIKFKYGTKYLNVFSPFSVSKETVSALITEGILDKQKASTLLRSNKFSRETLRYMVAPGSESFRRVVTQIVRELQIPLIQYSWQSSAGTFCNKHLTSAFVYVDDSSYKKDISSLVFVYWQGFSSAIELQSDEAEALARNQKLRPLLIETRETYNKMIATKDKKIQSKYREQIRSVFANAYSDNYSLDKIKENTFNCLLN